MTLHTLKNVRAWTEGVEVDRDAVAQIRNIASLPVLGGPGPAGLARAAALGDRGLGAGGRRAAGAL
jgi:hypothetical protein